MIIQHTALERLVSSVFRAAGCQAPEDDRVARYLVESNLVGHDSHGVIRVPLYVQWLKSGKVLANRQLQIAIDQPSFAVVDGEFGFGQSMGEAAVELGINKALQTGVAVVALRNCGHLGRIGDWPTLAAQRGLVSLHFVNTSGAGILVAPYGGISRRLSANPIAMGAPVDDGPPLILDISTCSIAEGKIKVAFNKGVRVPAGCIIDPQGQPTDDPRVFYANPPGAILPFGGHKGYGLSVMAEILAVALTGNGCSKTGVDRLSNGMLSIYLAPKFFAAEREFAEEVRKFIDFVRSSQPVAPDGRILLPGDFEEQTRQARSRDGIELDATTWGQIQDTCRLVGVACP